MRKTVTTSTTNQLLLKDNCFELDGEDLSVMFECFVFARDNLDMDNMDFIYKLNKLIEAFEKAE